MERFNEQLDDYATSQNVSRKQLFALQNCLEELYIRICKAIDDLLARIDAFKVEGEDEAAMADRETLQSVMETLSLRHKDPVGVLAEALKAYKPRFRRGMTAEERRMAKEAAAEKVADVLFPRDGRMKPKRE